MSEAAGKKSVPPAVLSLGQLLEQQPTTAPVGLVEPGLLPQQGILFVGGEPKVGKSLLVANLALSLAAGADRIGFPIPAPRRVLICQFELPVPQFVSRLAIIMELKLSTTENPLGKRALQAKYQQVEGQFELLTRRLSNFDLSKAASLAFDIASEQESTMVISLESKQGGRYNLTIYPPGGREVFHVNVKLADFQGPGKLDPAQLKSLAMVDITSASGGAPATNTIWIGKVETLSN